RLGWALTFGAVGICLLLGFRWHYQFALVIGESMRPTLEPGDLLIVDRNAYQATDPARGDIIVARYRHDLVVKRIVGLPGEEVEVKQGTLYIDGVPEAENHPTQKGRLTIVKGRLLKRKFATLGDNRATPSTQAIHPIISKDDILGKVILSFGSVAP